MIGRRLGQRYRIEELVGGGGMGQVYRATDLMLGRSVAVKVLRSEYAADEDFVQRFGREAQAAAILTHPNIRGVYDVGHEDGVHYIVMEYVDGETLKARIEREGPLRVDVALRYADEILAALETAHRARVVHRDIKPQNILIDEEDRIKVTDFGIARAFSGGQTIAHTGHIVGSAHYFSPEQARGGLIGEQSDLYSVGIVLYEMLTNKVPFEGESPISVAVRHLQDRVTPPREINPDIPPGVEGIILKALEKDPAYRYRSAAEMREDLQRVVAGDAPAAQRRPRAGRSSRDGQPRPPRRRALVGLLASLAVLLVAGITYSGWRILNYLDVPEVTVPDVAGRPLPEADALLREAGLVPTSPSFVNDDNVPDNAVIRSEPAANEKVRQGREVRLIVSRGPALTEVPNLIGKDIREVGALLEYVGLRMGEQAQVADPQPAGTVIDQDIPAQTRVTRGTAVNIVVSSGPAPVTVPNVIGLDEGVAMARITTAGLTVGLVERVASQRPKGEVLSTNPAPETVVPGGSPVSLLVSTGDGSDGGGIGGAGSGGGNGGGGGDTGGGGSVLPNRQLLTIPGPPGQGQLEVVVRVTDAAPRRVVSREPRTAGEPFQLTIEWTGPSAKVEVFVGDSPTPYFTTTLP